MEFDKEKKLEELKQICIKALDNSPFYFPAKKSFCDKCYQFSGHKLVYCKDCGNTMTYQDESFVFSYKQYINHALDDKNKFFRINEFLLHLICKEYDIKNGKQENYDYLNSPYYRSRLVEFIQNYLLQNI